MGPSTNVDGEPLVPECVGSWSRRFNGAVDERRRRGSRKCGRRQSRPGFNGAVDERRRRGAARGPCPARSDASMGPSTNVDGEVTIYVEPALYERWLQWGRRRTSTERRVGIEAL